MTPPATSRAGRRPLACGRGVYHNASATVHRSAMPGGGPGNPYPVLLGAAQLVRAEPLAGQADFTARCNQARDEEYAEVIHRCEDFLAELM